MEPALRAPKDREAIVLSVIRNVSADIAMSPASCVADEPALVLISLPFVSETLPAASVMFPASEATAASLSVMSCAAKLTSSPKRNAPARNAISPLPVTLYRFASATVSAPSPTATASNCPALVLEEPPKVMSAATSAKSDPVVIPEDMVMAPLPPRKPKEAGAALEKVEPSGVTVEKVWPPPKPISCAVLK